MNNAFGVFPSFIRKRMHALIKILVSDLSESSQVKAEHLS